MTVDIKGGKEAKIKVKKGKKREDGEPMNALIHLFSASLSLPGRAHLLSAPPASVHSYKSPSGILAGESRINTAGENVSAEGRQA